MKYKFFTIILLLLGVSQLQAQVNCQGIVDISLDNVGEAHLVVEMIESGNASGYINKWLDITYLDCSNIGTPVTVTLYAEKSNGDIDQCTSTIMVEDKFAPVVVLDGNITVALVNGVYALTFDDLDDGSWDNCEIDSYTISPPIIDCWSTNPQLTTLTIYDASGNSSQGVVDVNHSSGSSPFACNDDTEVNVLNGPVTITPELILEGGPYSCTDFYTTTVTDVDGVEVIDGIMNDSHIGQTFEVLIANPISLDSCWGDLTVISAGQPYGFCVKDYKGNAVADVDIQGGNVTDETGCTEVTSFEGALIGDLLKMDDPQSGLDVVDIMLMRESILGITDLAGEQLLAANLDFSSGTSVTTLDLVTLEKIINGDIVNDTPWVFVDSSYPFQDGEEPVDFNEYIVIGGESSYEFRGIKMGDIDMSYDELVSDADKTSLKIKDVVLNKGEIYMIPVTMSQATDLVAAEVKFLASTSEYQVNNISSSIESYTFDSETQITNNIAMFRWLGLEEVKTGGLAFDEDEILFTIEIVALENGILHNTFAFDESTLNKWKQANDNSGNHFKLDYTDFITVPNIETEYNISIDITPNPTTSFLKISSQDIALNNAEYIIRDMAGKTIQAGMTLNNHRVSVSQLTSGIYSLQVFVNGKNIQPQLFTKM